jgi:Stability determinant
MREDRMTIRVDRTLKQRFLKFARQQDRPASGLLREFMQKIVAKPSSEASAYDKWFQESVQQAKDDPRPAVPSAEVERHFERRRKGSRRKFSRKS